MMRRGDQAGVQSRGGQQRSLQPRVLRRYLSADDTRRRACSDPDSSASVKAQGAAGGHRGFGDPGVYVLGDGEKAHYGDPCSELLQAELKSIGLAVRHATLEFNMSLCTLDVVSGMWFEINPKCGLGYG